MAGSSANGVGDRCWLGTGTHLAALSGPSWWWQEGSAGARVAARGSPAIVRCVSTARRYYLHVGTDHERRQRLVTAVLIGATGGAALVGLPLLAWLLVR
jgi:hypothetical protein